jgi:hypothetical protein
LAYGVEGIGGFLQVLEGLEWPDAGVPLPTLKTRVTWRREVIMKRAVKVFLLLVGSVVVQGFQAACIAHADSEPEASIVKCAARADGRSFAEKEYPGRTWQDLAINVIALGAEPNPHADDGYTHAVGAGTELPRQVKDGAVRVACTRAGSVLLIAR